MPVYKVCVFYSAEDDGYIAVVPDLPGCSAFGDTREEALKEIRTALSLWLETAREIGKEIPPGILSSNVQSGRNDTDYIEAGDERLFFRYRSFDR